MITKKTTIARIAIQAPAKNLVMSTITRTTAVKESPIALMARERIIRRRSAGSRSSFSMPRPVPDHAELAEVEGDEDADDVELDQPGDLGVEDLDQDDRHQGQEDDAVAVGQPVAARAQRSGRVAVLGQDRAQDREAVERRVGREHQDDAGDGDDEVEAGREVDEHRSGDLRDHRVLVVVGGQRLTVEGEPVEVVRVDVLEPHLVRERDHAEHHRDGDRAQHQQRGGGVLALRAPERRHPVGDRLDTGQRGAARGEGPGQQEHQRDRRQRVRPSPPPARCPGRRSRPRAGRPPPAGAARRRTCRGWRP